MKYLLAKKIGMSQKFTDSGESVSYTMVQAGPCIVTQVKKKEKDGYSAVQIGFDNIKKVNKPKAGHIKNLGNLKYLREFRLEDNAEIKLNKGDSITVSQFVPGDKVKVTGVSIGRGFQGVVKRHGFHGGPASHGHKDNLRMPGSIGCRSYPGRVFKGKRMGGHMGDRQVSIRNLKVIEVDQTNNILYLKGAVPGAKNGYLMIYGKN